MKNEMTHKKFDEITLEYAKNVSIMSKIEDRFESYAIYLLESIDKSVKEHIASFSKKHTDYSFSQDSSEHEEYFSSIIVSKKDVSILEFAFGFDYDFKLKNKNRFRYSKEGYTFFTQLYFHKEIVGDKLSFEKYWEENLGEFCQNNNWAIHNHQDDKNKWVYITLLPVDDNFTFKKAHEKVINDIMLLFKNKKEFS